MDPGTALGIVSLGIQVCEGLLGYYRDYKRYEEDCQEAYTRLRNKQLSGAQKVQIDLLDYLFEPSSFLHQFNSYLDR